MSGFRHRSSVGPQNQKPNLNHQEPLQIDQLLFEHRHLMVDLHFVDLVDASFVGEVLKRSLMGWECIGFSTRHMLTC